MKRLLFTVTTDLNYDQRMQRICSSLAEAGYDARLIGRANTKSIPLQERTFGQTRLNCLFGQGILFYAEYNMRLFFHLLFSKADLICGIDLDTALAALWAAKIKRVPFVYDAHEYFPEVPEVQARPRTKSIWEAIERHVLKRTRYAYTVSASIAKLFEEKYGTPVSLIRNLPLERPLPVKKNSTKKYIVYSGAVNEGRGIKEMLLAMPRLDCEFHVCGDGDILEEMKRLSEKLGLGEKVKFYGYLRPAQLHKVVADAYIGIMLLEQKGLSYYYSLANKFFDYIQAGIPQVCIDFPEYRRINDRDEVTILVNMHVEEIAVACQKLLEDSVLYERLAANARTASKKYTWSQESKVLVQYYDDIFRE